MARRNRFHLRVVGYREGSQWVAHCLETDYLGYGDTFPEALVDLAAATQCVIASYLADGQPADRIFHRGAPRRFWALYDRAVQRAEIDVDASRAA